MQVEPARADDLPRVRAIYADARATQREQGSIVWPEFTDAAILAEIEAGRLLRLGEGGAVAGVFSVAYEDGAIWGERECGAHIYLHRISRAAEYRGPGLVECVLQWARQQCRSLGRAGLRMDTWASNTALIAYYRRLGFTLVGTCSIGLDSPLPAHYHGREFALLEEACNDDRR